MARPPPRPAPARPARAAAGGARPGRGAGLRLFVAVDLPAPQAAHLAAALGRDPDPRWHVTLAFLGEREAAPSLDGLQVTPFALALGGAGTFGGRVLWVGVRRGAPELTALAGQVADVLGVREDRPYRPHLTVRRGRDLDPGPLADYAGPPWTADRATLYESRGGRYVPLAVTAATTAG